MQASCKACILASSILREFAKVKTEMLYFEISLSYFLNCSKASLCATWCLIFVFEKSTSSNFFNSARQIRKPDMYFSISVNNSCLFFTEVLRTFSSFFIDDFTSEIEVFIRLLTVFVAYF